MTDQTETIPWIAERIRDAFPELEGRAIAVSFGDVTEDLKPTLPIAIVAPGRQTFQHNGGNRLNVVERFSAEFWLEPARIKYADGSETPFWSAFASNAFRDRMFTLFAGARTPQNGAITFEQMEVDASEFAVVIAFAMQATYIVCPDDQKYDECGVPIPPTDGLPVKIDFTMCAPKGRCDPPEQDPVIDPCTKEPIE